MKPTCSIIVPAYNEEEGIVPTIEAITDAIPRDIAYELIVVDDGSTDETSSKLADLESLNSELVIRRHEKNRGYGASLKTGIRSAKAELIAIIDADGTYPADALPELIQVAEKTDMVVGARVGDDVHHSAVRSLPKRVLRSYIEWLVKVRVVDFNSGLRVFRREIAERFFGLLPDGFSFTTTLTIAMLNNNYDVRFISVGYAPRVGKSKIRPLHDTFNFLQLIVRTGLYFSPLRVFLPICGVLFVAVLVSATYDVLILNNLTDKTLILLMFGLNTGLLGLLADMIDRRSPQ